MTTSSHSETDMLFKGERLTLALHDAIARIELFNPPNGYFDVQSEREFLRALDVLADRGDARVLVITGRDEGMFVRHYDVGVLEKIGRKMVERDLRFDPENPPPPSSMHRILQRLESAPFICIAAINGWCMGGGLELALACHLRYAQAGDYLIGLLEVQLHLLPGAGGTQRLGRVVGQARALEMLLLGTCVCPEDAERIGLVHSLVNDVQLHSNTVATLLASRPPHLLQHVVRLHADAQQLAWSEGMERERGAFSAILRDEETLRRLAEFNSGTVRVPE